MTDIQIVQVEIEKLQPAAYNPRKWSEDEKINLNKSIDEFGLVDPIIANSAEGRENIVIGGHFRLQIAKERGMKTVPVVYLNIPTEEKEKELNLRLNKNLGTWDWEMLKNFSEEMLIEIGFLEGELGVVFGLLEVEGEDVDVERLKLLEVQPPESPRLKDRCYLQFKNKADYDVVKKWINEDGEAAEMVLEIARKLA